MKTKTKVFVRGFVATTALFLTACSQTNIVRSNIDHKPQPEEVRTALGTEGSNTLSKSFDPSAITEAHNQWRSKVGAPALRWSEKLADVAKTWAEHLEDNSCSMFHSQNGYGENLYKASPIMWSSGRRELQEKTPQDVTDSWGNEIKSYNYANNSCSGVCGHYTQLVWKDTTDVGCAMTICEDKAQIWVCNYYPAGNVVGKKPY